MAPRALLVPAALTFLATLSTGCLFSFESYRVTNSSMTIGAERRTEEREIAITVDERAEEVIWAVAIEGDGRATWSVHHLGPDEGAEERTLASGALEGGEVDTDSEVPAAPGTWTLRWRLEEFSGDTDFRLVATDG